MLQVQKYGMVVKSPTQGIPVQSPYLPIINRQAEIMLRAASELGFSPTSRSRITLTDPGKKKENRFSNNAAAKCAGLCRRRRGRPQRRRRCALRVTMEVVLLRIATDFPICSADTSCVAVERIFAFCIMPVMAGVTGMDFAQSDR